MSAMLEDRVNFIRVINQNPKEVRGRYAGRDYVFKPNVPLDVPEIVARHIFDFGKDDKSQALNRLGWATTSDGMADGLAMLDNVVFDDPPEMVEKPKEAGPGRPRGKRTVAATSPVASSGTEGGEYKSPPNGPRIGEAESALPASDAEGDETF